MTTGGSDASATADQPRDADNGNAANPRVAAVLMGLTYLAGALGLFIGFFTISRTPPSLTIATLLAVGLAGGLSFVRHSITHASDAARMGWTSGTRNNFQIEVGLANLAWALLAVAAVVFDWGIRVQAGSLLVFGFYLLAVSVFIATARGDGQSRPWGQVAGMGLFAVMLTVLGIMGMQAG